MTFSKHFGMLGLVLEFDTEVGGSTLVSGAVKRLGEYVGQLVVGPNVVESNEFLLKGFAYDVILDVDMLGSWEAGGLATDFDGRLIVDVERGRLVCAVAELLKDVSKPADFRNGL